MNTRSVTALLGTFGLGILFAWPGLARSQDDEAAPPSPEGVEVLTRGPVHEAYAEPVDSRAAASPIIPKQPPDPIEEVPSEMKPEGDNVVWIPGYWAWDDSRSDYIWVSGFWRVPPPDRQWVPGHWDQTDDGWQWTPGFWAAADQTDVQYLPPPPPSIDAGASTPAPSTDAVYSPGTWVYQDTRYLWRPGFWVTPQAGWVWVPAHYIWTPVGYVFVDGHWDYPLADRGLLFTPVAINYAAVRRGWYYRPSYVVNTNFLLGALFVRPTWSSYYFGDYFDPRFRNLGFTAWVDYRVGRAAYDPLFAYYRWQYRDNPAWAREIRTLYAGRFDGSIARPPATLAQQRTVIQKITNQNITNKNTIINNLTAAAPVNQFRSSTVHLTRITEQQAQHYQQVAHAFRDVSVHRGQTERQLLSEGPAPVRHTDRARTARIEVPRAAVTTVKPLRAAPPAPRYPSQVARPIPRYEAPRPQVHRPVAPAERPEARPGERPAGRPPEARPPERPAPRPPEATPAPRPPERPAPQPPAPKPPPGKQPEKPKKDK
jgi:hypothetical protein